MKNAFKFVLMAIMLIISSLNVMGDLTQYPQNLIVDHQLNAVFFVDEEAPASDVMAAVDILMSIDRMTSVSDSLDEGEIKVYTIGGFDYEVEAVTVSGSTSAVLKVNGQLTDALAIGGYYTLHDGTEISVDDIIQPVVKFTLHQINSINAVELLDEDLLEEAFAEGNTIVFIGGYYSGEMMEEILEEVFEEEFQIDINDDNGHIILIEMHGVKIMFVTGDSAQDVTNAAEVLSNNDGSLDSIKYHAVIADDLTVTQGEEGFATSADVRVWAMTQESYEENEEVIVRVDVCNDGPADASNAVLSYNIDDSPLVVETFTGIPADSCSEKDLNLGVLDKGIHSLYMAVESDDETYEPFTENNDGSRAIAVGMTEDDTLVVESIKVNGREISKIEDTEDYETDIENSITEVKVEEEIYGYEVDIENGTEEVEVEIKMSAMVDFENVEFSAWLKDSSAYQEFTLLHGTTVTKKLTLSPTGGVVPEYNMEVEVFARSDFFKVWKNYNVQFNFVEEPPIEPPVEPPVVEPTLIVSDLVFGNSLQERDVSVNKTLTIQNPSNEKITVKSMTHNVASKYNLTFAFAENGEYKADLGSFAVAKNTTVTVYAKAYVPEDQYSGLRTLGGINVYHSENKTASSTVKMETEGKLEIKKVKFTTEDDSETMDNGETFETSAGETIDVLIEVENMFNDDEDIEIEDVNVELIVEEMDDDDDLEKDDDLDDLDAEEEAEITLSFKVPSDADGKYDVIVKVEGTDKNGAKHYAERKMYVDVDKNKEDLEIYRMSLSRDSFTCEGGSATLSITVRNIGERDDDNAMLIIENAELGLNKKETGIELESDEDDDDNEQKFSYTITVPKGKTGTFPIRASLYFDGDELVDTRDVTIMASECGSTASASTTSSSTGSSGSTSTGSSQTSSSSTSTEAVSTTETDEEFEVVYGINQGQDSYALAASIGTEATLSEADVTEDSFSDSGAYIALMAVGFIGLLGGVVYLGAFAYFKIF